MGALGFFGGHPDSSWSISRSEKGLVSITWRAILVRDLLSLRDSQTPPC